MGRKIPDWPDFEEQHTLTEEECEVVGLYRAMTKTQRQVVLRTLLELSLIWERKRMMRKRKPTGDAGVEEAGHEP